MVDEDNHFRDLRSPIGRRDLRPLDPKCERVQFSDPLSTKDVSALATFMKDYPNVELRVYGHNGRRCNLNFLEHFPFLRRFAIEAHKLDGLDGLQNLSPKLQSLKIGSVETQKHSLKFLERFVNLRHLELDSHQKDIEVLSGLLKLEDLTLRSIKLPDLQVLLPLTKLRSLSIKLGGTTDLGLLPNIGKLQFLKLWMVRGLTDLSPVSKIHSLQFLFLHALRNVSALPSFSALRQLRRINLLEMKGLENIEALAEAKALEDLVVWEMPQLNAKHFLPLIGHRRLKRTLVWLKNERTTAEANSLLSCKESDFLGEDFVFTKPKTR